MLDRSRVSFFQIGLRLLLFGLLSVLSASVALAQVSATALPSGFSDEVVVPGLLAPRAFTFTPDGRILILERGSAATNDINFASVRVFKNGSLLATRALTLTTCGDSERGLLGIALDNSFASSGYLYVYYTRQSTSGAACGYNTYTNGVPGPRNRISRFTMVGDTIDPASERILVDNIVTDVGYHNAGDLHMSSDGYLYATTGEGGISSLAPDTSTINGKVLRILPNPSSGGGYTTPGNPFDTASGARYCGLTPQPTGSGPCREVFAYGFRNPFRFTLQPGTNVPFVGDVGAGAWEEIDRVVPGGNYGWPTREGPCPTGVVCSPPFTPSSFSDPIYAYSHQVVNANVDSAVIGGGFYTGGSYPSDYVNNYFFADVIRGFIRRLIFNSSNNTWTAPPQDFATNVNGIVGLKTGPNGDFYYVTYTADTRVDAIHRIRFSGAQNVPPVAQISVVSSGTGSNPTFTFSAQGSNDPDGNLPLSYTWNFGDGSAPVTTSSLTVNHTYNNTSNATVTLVATDSLGLASSPASVTVYPNNIPATADIVLTNQTNSGRTSTATYYAGDTWQYAVANANDPDGGPLPSSAFSWSIVFHHREHTHPFIPTASGTTGTFTIPVSGETDPVVWYRVILQITDARGAVSTVQRDVNPVTRDITLTTNPAGGQVNLEGANFTAPYTVTRVVGINIPISVTSPQTIGGTAYQFANWSDGGAQTHTIAVPATNTTYTAAFVAPTPTSTPNTGSTQTITLQIGAGGDDVTDNGTTFETSSGTVWIGNAGNANASFTGLRFNNVQIPSGAVINSAHLEFYSTQSQWIPLTLQIAAEAVDSSAPFSTSNRPGSRVRTTTRINHSSNEQWNANAWYSLDESKAVIQEVINRSNWRGGNSLSIIIQGLSTGVWSRKFAASYENNNTRGARLVITFTASGSQPNNTPTPIPTNPPPPTPVPPNTPTFTPVPNAGTVTVSINSGADDVNEVNTALDAAGSTLWLGNGGTTTTSFTGLRFNGVAVPRGATITSARLEFYSTQSQWLSISLQIAADAANSSSPFTATNRPGQRTLTTARVNHTSDVQWNANTWYPFDDIRAIVQEVVNRGGWQSGNSMSLILRGTGTNWGRKFFRSFEGGAAFSARLVITYTT